MKRFALALLTLFTIASLPSASAAIVAKPLVQIAQVDSAATGILIANDQIAVFGNREKKIGRAHV